MITRRAPLQILASASIGLSLCFPSVAAPVSAEDISELKRAIQALQAQNQALAARVATLEAEKSTRDRTTRYERASREQQPPSQPMRVEADSKERLEQQGLEQRVRELEITQYAQEDATRAIIRDSVSTLGSNINESVAFGGTLEVVTGRTKDFSGQSENLLQLSTAELDFEVRVNEWTLGSLILEYDDGTDVVFPTTEGFETGVERVNVDTAFITIGDPQRFPPFLTAGRVILPFGISTGDPVADVLSIEDPLTIEAFEMRRTAIGFGVGFPTPPLTPPTPPVTPPPVRPLVINPVVSSVSRSLGYDPPPTRPPPLASLSPTPEPPPFNAAIYSYNGSTYEGVDKGWSPQNHFDATFGFRTKGHCGRPYDELRATDFCPWSIDLDIDYNSSVFDSRFLESEYQSFLGQIGFVPGMAASIKATLGPVSLVGEWNGAIDKATFVDDIGNAVNISPAAWQLSLGYQFDWNPWVEEIGAQGDYFSIGYSESSDLAGVTRLIDNEPVRVGSVPRRRILVSAGEWVLDGLKFAVEYSYNWDYGTGDGGTGKSANGIIGALTYVW